VQSTSTVTDHEHEAAAAAAAAGLMTQCRLCHFTDFVFINPHLSIHLEQLIFSKYVIVFLPLLFYRFYCLLKVNVLYRVGQKTGLFLGSAIFLITSMKQSKSNTVKPVLS